MSTDKTQPKKMHRRFQGTVVQVASDKTANVLVKTTKMHAKYQKQYVESKKYAVHDPKNEAKIGDEVLFEECRPLSKTKRWRLLEVTKKAA